jgi:hypothetical protein
MVFEKFARAHYFYTNTIALKSINTFIRAQFRCDVAVRRKGNYPELGSDPNLFASAGRGFTRPPAVKIPLLQKGWRVATG